jgi:uncharacterized repeat protein (TIGR03803 family)
MKNTAAVCHSTLPIYVALSRPALWLSVIALLLLSAFPTHAQTLTVLHEFAGGNDGTEPQAGLVSDAYGNMYGTTYGGGTYGWGTVFKLDASGNETVVHSFAGIPDGAQPMDGLIIDKDGNLYGTTFSGGASGGGAVFKVDASGQETVLHSFVGFSDGAYPSGGLVMDADGIIYGTTQEGGSGTSCWGGCGTVFKLDKAGNATVMFSFQSPAEYPTVAMTLDAGGALYGTTSGNGSCCLGTVFRLGQDSLAESLHTFTGGAGGTSPDGSLVRDSKGRLYGTTFVGGDLGCALTQGVGCGVVYELSPEGDETVLHSFSGQPDGAVSLAGLLRDKDGRLYGTTIRGGTSNYGTVFKLDKRGKLTILHSFVNTDGAIPESVLIQDASGNLYGTTFEGGNPSCNPPYGCGVVFKITPK